MIEYFHTDFCGAAGCGWQYLWHYVSRAAYHLGQVDPMLAVVSFAGWALAANAGLAPKRQGIGFLRWCWLTALFLAFLREPLDSAAVDHWSKSY